MAEQDDEASIPAEYDRWTQVLFAVYPKLWAFLSIVGSGSIVYELIVASSPHKKLGPVQKTIILLSTGDIFSSAGFFLSTWVMPSDTPNVAFAIGTTATCTATGFFYQMGLTTTVLSNASLACSYLLIIRYNWTNRSLEKIHRVLLLFIFIYALGTAVAGLPLTLYNDAKIICHIHSYPVDCRQEWLGGEQDGTYKQCTRGENASLYMIIFNLLPLWLAIIFAIACMVLVYRFVKKTETETLRNHLRRREQSSSTAIRDRTSSTFGNASIRISNYTHPSEERFKNTKAAGSRALWYSCVFLITYLPVTLSLFLWTGGVVGKSGVGGIVVDLVAYTFLPLQGFLNFMVFAQTRTDFQGSVACMLKKIINCMTCFLHMLQCYRCGGFKSNQSNTDSHDARSSSPQPSDPEAFFETPPLESHSPLASDDRSISIRSSKE